jgi:hypothetical protein
VLPNKRPNSAARKDADEADAATAPTAIVNSAKAAVSRTRLLVPLDGLVSRVKREKGRADLIFVGS